MLTVYCSLADIPEHGQLMFILGTLVLYPQCRIELSVMRQQMLESGGKKILLGADAAEGQTAEQDLAEALDKTLDNLRKVVTSRALFCAAHLPSSIFTSTCQTPQRLPAAINSSHW